MNAPVGRLQAGGAVARSASRPIRLLIVDDSLVIRTILGRLLGEREEFEIAGSVGSVAHALQVLGRERVDIILLDLQLPDTDGLAGLPSLLAAGAGARVLIVSSLTGEGAAASVRAMTLGAVDTLLKPGAGGLGARFGEMLVDRLLRIGLAEGQASAKAQPAPAEPDAAPFPPQRGPIACIGIGSSTGGLHALHSLLALLPADLSAPIAVTQHLPPAFMPYFAGQLRESTGRHAFVGTEGAVVEPRSVVVAPGDAHLRIVGTGEDLRIRLDRAPVSSQCLPSVDPMFDSIASLFGGRAIGIVLSGMGRDGAVGAARLVAAGAEVFAQDRASSVVWGMPGTVARAGLASLVAPADRLAERIAWRHGCAEHGQWR
jgi:two-component system, chemotaxis family, protein-glutamate methylesterase/glutaminase